ncbi:MAG: hypothetical protein LBU23_12485, partial [Planctomycetota bacterium]|nr:hypothetical protein [Planctomycetota bacterium]
MYEERGNKGLWVGLLAAGALMIVFVILWFFRGAEITRLENELRDSQSTAANASRRLETDLRTAETDLDSANRKITDLEAQAKRVREQLERAENSSRSEISSYSAKLQASIATAANLGQELDAARAQAAAAGAAAQKELSAANGELDNLRRELSAANGEIAGLRKEQERGRGEAVALRRELAESVKVRDARLAVLENELRAAKAEFEQASAASAAKSGAELAKAKARLAALDGDLSSAKIELATKAAELQAAKLELTLVRDDYGKNLAKARDDAKSEIERQRQTQAGKLAETENLWRDRLAAAERSAAEREKAFSAARVAMEQRMAGLEKQLANAAAPAAAVKPVVKPPIQSRATASGNGPSGRAVAKIVDRLADGQTLLLSIGVEERMRPGMKFDVYRQESDGRRFIGNVKVIRVMLGCSMLVSTFSETEVATCPVTGRAVLESGAKFSPFAVSGDGKALPLKTAAALGLPLEAPAVGDLLDNPFYDPDRPLAFALDPKLR